MQVCSKKHHVWLQVFLRQEPHCLNTSILDCSVTFTVDKDVWIHGIEVPSQVTDVPEQLAVSGSAAALPGLSPARPQLERLQPPVEGLPSRSRSSTGYSELLYAHLLDGEVRGTGWDIVAVAVALLFFRARD